MAKAIVSKGKVVFRQSMDDFGRIMEMLRAKRYRRTYLLMGEEPYFIDRISDYISENVLSEEEKSFNRTVLYGNETNVVDLIELCRGYPMLSAYNVVVVKEAQRLRGIEQLVEYLKVPMDTTLLVLCYKEGNLDKRSALYKKLSETGTVFESVRPRDYEIGTWILELFRNKGRSIEPKAVSMLVENLGTELSKINNEVEKLFTRLAPEEKEIRAEHIEQNIGISKDFNNFELTKALSERDAKKALLIVGHFAQNPKDNPFVVTIQALFSHFLRLFTLGIVIWNSKAKRAPMPGDAELMRLLKVSSAYFLKEYRQAVVHYNSTRSFAVLGLLREYDMKSKGIGGGTAGDGELLKELVIKILAL